MTPLTFTPESKEMSRTIEFDQVNEWEIRDGRDFAVIDHLEEFDPFFLSIATVTNQWFFCSSNGSLSAGRENPEKALFPYLTVDKILGNWNETGPFTAIECGGEIWHPFWPTSIHTTPIRRRLLKSFLGEELIFEEWNENLELRFSYHWQLSGKFGFVRKVKITNEGSETKNFRIVDGLQDLQVPGVSQRLHLDLSCLADAYKMSEVCCEGRLMIHRLASGIVDAPIPLESLKATTVWTTGFSEAEPFLSRRDAEQFLRGESSDGNKTKSRGKRGAFLLGADLSVPAGESKEWMMVAEIEQTHREVGSLVGSLRDELTLLTAVEEDLEEGRKRLRELVESVDGFQKSADLDTSHYHYHNTLCNLLRGGLPENGSVLSAAQFKHFVIQNNRELAERFEDWFSSLPESFERDWIMAEARRQGDSDLIRLTTEYLPLILGRRHGDPSRPWNKFNIRLHDEEGRPVHHYEGNWRDIFQNWEALAWSYPVFLDGFISRFLNASTVDGFNPYRVTSSGVDWEVPDPEDPWVSIGYWGDHQIIYLLKFLELKAKIDPEFLDSWSESHFVFADVPYRLASWEKTLADPRDTVEFDEERHDQLLARKEEIGGDGLLLCDEGGEIIRVGLIEKLLIPAMAKLGQLIPDGGIWMNAQKPEWNDANNALAGNGLSVVTTGYLLRYLRFLQRSIEACRLTEFLVSKATLQAVQRLAEVLGDPRWKQNDLVSSNDRFELAQANGLVMQDYRDSVREGICHSGSLPASGILSFLSHAIVAVEGVLQSNRRPDGLWHAYNVLDARPGNPEMKVQNLQLMLEGQVAILSSGFLENETAVSLLEDLAKSDLRSKRHPTYLLYPDRELAGFDELNRIPDADLRGNQLLASMAKKGDERLVYEDGTGAWRFNETLVNGYALTDCLTQIGDLSLENRTEIEKIYEKVFSHHSFTGRSGSMFGYEGLGCVYWHMVSKLMLAAQEVALAVCKSGKSSDELKSRSVAAYYAVQRGLGFRQTPQSYGAFPAEPYSHSQGERGAQQPGLTGQVKEGLLCRLGELGIDFEDGQLSFRPHLLRAAEFVDGVLSFTHARTPLQYESCEDLETPKATVFKNDGQELVFSNGVLDIETSSSILFNRGTVAKVIIQIPSNWLIF
jgi:hypothetical protein